MSPASPNPVNMLRVLQRKCAPELRGDILRHPVGKAPEVLIPQQPRDELPGLPVPEAIRDAGLEVLCIIQHIGAEAEQKIVEGAQFAQ